MTSMFSTARPSHNFRNELKEINSKKEALNSLEAELKKRINELRELCLKEGELTGHLPIDYPLQPREPIPQVRRRVNHSSKSLNSNNNDNNSEKTNGISPPCSIPSRQHKPEREFYPTAIANPNARLAFPSRPTSTNSTSSSLSTASSSNHLVANTGYHPVKTLPTSYSNPSSLGNNEPNNTSNQYREQINNVQRGAYHVPRYDPSILPNHFRKPYTTAHAVAFTLDNDALSHIRASSTTSSASSSGSAASSTLSAPVASQFKAPILLNSNMHARSCSEDMAADAKIRNHHLNDTVICNRDINKRFNVKQPSSAVSLDCPPVRPPRGSIHAGEHHASRVVSFNELSRQQTSENKNSTSKGSNLIVDSSQATKPLQLYNVNELQPYFEETKPFQMSDFYKYSSKHRQKDSPVRQKTTRQLQEDVSRLKSSLKFSSCDDQIQASVKLIEKSGQKLFEATAKAIAGNPGIAEKLNNILPNNGDRY